MDARLWNIGIRVKDVQAEVDYFVELGGRLRVHERLTTPDGEFEYALVDFGGTRLFFTPQTVFEGRIRRLDMRVTKIFQLTNKVRFQANLDAYNALNSSAIQSLQTAFGTSWLSPTTILDPRILQVSGQLSF